MRVTETEQQAMWLLVVHIAEMFGAEEFRIRQLQQAAYRYHHEGHLEHYLDEKVSPREAAWQVGMRWLSEQESAAHCPFLFRALVERVETLQGLEAHARILRQEAIKRRITGQLDGYLAGRASLDQAVQLVVGYWQATLKVSQKTQPTEAQNRKFPLGVVLRGARDRAAKKLR